MLHNLMEEYEGTKQEEFKDLYHESLHDLENVFNLKEIDDQTESEVYAIHEELFDRLDTFLREYGFFLPEE